MSNALKRNIMENTVIGNIASWVDSMNILLVITWNV